MGLENDLQIENKNRSIKFYKQLHLIHFNFDSTYKTRHSIMKIWPAEIKNN